MHSKEAKADLELMERAVELLRDVRRHLALVVGSTSDRHVQAEAAKLLVRADRVETRAGELKGVCASNVDAAAKSERPVAGSANDGGERLIR